MSSILLPCTHNFCFVGFVSILATPRVAKLKMRFHIFKCHHPVARFTLHCSRPFQSNTTVQSPSYVSLRSNNKVRQLSPPLTHPPPLPPPKVQTLHLESRAFLVHWFDSVGKKLVFSQPAMLEYCRLTVRDKRSFCVPSRVLCHSSKQNVDLNKTFWGFITELEDEI
jgi:hypothetical protein